MTTARQDDKETTDQRERFLGHIATVVESWRLLLIVPALIAALSYAYLATRPDFYQSNAILRLTRDDVVILKSERLFGEAVRKIGGVKPPDEPAPASLAVDTASSSVSGGNLDSRDDYNVAVTYHSAAGAAAILQDMIDRLPAETVPSPYDRARLESRIKVLTQAQENVVRSLANMNEMFDRVAKGEQTPDSIGFAGEYGQSVAELSNTLATNDQFIGAARTELQPTFGPSDVIQAPTVPTQAVARSLSPLVTLMFVLSFGVLLVLVLARAALNNRESSPNLARVRRALRPWARS